MNNYAMGKAKTLQEAIKLVDEKGFKYLEVSGLKSFGDKMMEESKK